MRSHFYSWLALSSTLPAGEILNELYQLCGLVLISLQETEFIIHGIVSHFNENLLKSNKNFKELTPRAFLDDDTESRKKRRQTLGVIIGFFSDTSKAFNHHELNVYVSDRNRFVHTFWRDFLGKNRISEKQEVEKAISFVLDLYKSNIKWNHIFKGLLYDFAKTLWYRNLAAGCLGSWKMKWHWLSLWICNLAFC